MAKAKAKAKEVEEQVEEQEIEISVGINPHQPIITKDSIVENYRNMGIELNEAQLEQFRKNYLEKLNRPAGKTGRVKRTVMQNGVSRPLSGTSLIVWTIADKLSESYGRPVESKELREHCLGIKAALVSAEFTKWKKFHGIPLDPNRAGRKGKKVTEEIPS